MTDHPNTYKAGETPAKGIAWDDRASLHLKDERHGLFDSAKALRRGTLAEMIRHVMMMPETVRGNYVIHKSGDHTLSASEIAGLASRDDFPG